MMDDEQRYAQRAWALADDENLIDIMAWRIVKARAEAGGFNGLVISDFQLAREVLEQLKDGP